MKYLVFVLSAIMSVFSHFSLAADWNHEVHGSFPVFFTYSDTDNGEAGSQIMSGFNPANMTITSMAPKQDGLDISATLQITSHLQGGKEQNSGLFESRVAEIKIAGDFGQVNIGKGFGIFNSNAIGDVGSAKGVGHIPNAPDRANATNGHIGTGYVYANFNPRIMYSSQLGNSGSYKVGIFNPEEPGDDATAETALPRFEGQLTMNVSEHSVWAGFMFQSVESTVEDYDIQAFDIGGQLNLGALGVRAAYTVTQSIGADGLYGYGGIADANVDGSQAYVEGTFNMGAMTYGVSYGIGTQDSGTNASGAVAEIENTLAMLFAHKKISDHLHLMFEVQSYSSDDSVAKLEYTAVSTGIQVDF
ncbi:MAG: hypothetical protein ACI8SR_002347 [Oceanicoccus sp.]|jgi:hypothetical protein